MVRVRASSKVFIRKKVASFSSEFLISFYKTSFLSTRRLVPCEIKRESMCLVWQNPSDLSALRKGGIFAWLVPGLQGLRAQFLCPGHPPLLPAPCPPELGLLGWLGRPLDCKDNWCFQAASSWGFTAPPLTCLWAGLGLLEPVRLVWRLLLQWLSEKGWRPRSLDMGEGGKRVGDGDGGRAGIGAKGGEEKAQEGMEKKRA